MLNRAKKKMKIVECDKNGFDSNFIILDIISETSVSFGQMNNIDIKSWMYYANSPENLLIIWWNFGRVKNSHLMISYAYEQIHCNISFNTTPKKHEQLCSCYPEIPNCQCFGNKSIQFADNIKLYITEINYVWYSMVHDLDHLPILNQQYSFHGIVRFVNLRKIRLLVEV